MKTIVLMARGMGSYVVPGSVEARCRRCNRICLMSPSSLAIKEPGDDVLCLNCFDTEASASHEPIELMPLSNWQRRELRSAGIQPEAAR